MGRLVHLRVTLGREEAQQAIIGFVAKPVITTRETDLPSSQHRYGERLLARDMEQGAVAPRQSGLVRSIHPFDAWDKDGVSLAGSVEDGDRKGQSFGRMSKLISLSRLHGRRVAEVAPLFGKWGLFQEPKVCGSKAKTLGRAWR